MARLLCSLLLIALPALSWAQSIPAMTWGSAVNVSNTPGQSSYHPQVAATGDTVHVIWWENAEAPPMSLYYKRSLNGGTTWQDQRALSTTMAYVYKVVAYGNNVIAFWVDQVSGQYIVRSARSADVGATWSATQDISPALSSIPQGVDGAAGSGRVVIQWGEISGSTASLKMRISTDDGQTWGSTLNVTSFNYDTNEGAFAGMALAGSAIVVGYLESPFAVRTVRSTDWGLTWSSPALVYSDPSHSMHHLRMAASGSSVVMRWERFFGAYNSEAMAAGSADGGITWSIPATLAAAGLGADNGYGDVCVWGNRAVAVWINNDSAVKRLYYRRSLDGGQTWEGAIQISLGMDFYPPKCAATSNAVYVVGLIPLHLSRGSWFDDRVEFEWG